MKILEGIKVIDLSSVLAGPSVATFLAELGAEVLKFENPNGDVTRTWKLPSEDADVSISAYYASVNYKKDIAFLNLKDEEDRERLYLALRQADILIENFKPGDLTKFRLRPEETKQLNAQLIHCHLAGFLFEAHRLAYDVVLQAETGFMFMNGEHGGVKMPVALMDVLAAHQMKEAILAALFQREKTGKGAYINATLEQAGLAALTNQASNYLMTGHIPQPIGSQHPNIAPYGDTFECADGRKVVLAIGSDKQFALMCGRLNCNALPEDERFKHNGDRVRNRADLIAALQTAFSLIEAETFLKWCHSNKVPAGEIRDLAQVSKTQAAKHMLREEEQDGVQTKRFSSIGFSITPFSD